MQAFLWIHAAIQNLKLYIILYTLLYSLMSFGWFFFTALSALFRRSGNGLQGFVAVTDSLRVKTEWEVSVSLGKKLWGCGRLLQEYWLIGDGALLWYKVEQWKMIWVQREEELFLNEGRRGQLWKTEVVNVLEMGDKEFGKRNAFLSEDTDTEPKLIPREMLGMKKLEEQKTRTGLCHGYIIMKSRGKEEIPHHLPHQRGLSFLQVCNYSCLFYD